MKVFSKNYKISEFLPNLGNFHVWSNWNFDQITKFQPNYEILTKFLNFNKVLKFQQNFRISILFWNFKKNGILTKFQNVHQILVDLFLHKLQINLESMCEDPAAQLWSSSQASKPTNQSIFKLWCKVKSQ